MVTGEPVTIPRRRRYGKKREEGEGGVKLTLPAVLVGKRRNSVDGIGKVGAPSSSSIVWEYDPVRGERKRSTTSNWFGWVKSRDDEIKRSGEGERCQLAAMAGEEGGRGGVA